jgi:Fantastic Four meristem regulator
MPALNQADTWAAIQSVFDASTPKISKELLIPFVHPLSRRSSQLMSQKSLKICTENLGSETGSEFSSDESSYFFSDSDSDESEFETFFKQHTLTSYDSYNSDSPVEGKELMAVNYHGSGGSSVGRTFPPPLPSIARRDGRPCVRMQPHRQNGRLVVQAVPVRSNTYLHANRQEGRLRLCFIDCASRVATTEITNEPQVLPVSEKEVERQVPQEEVEKVVTEEEEAVEVEEELEEEEEEVEVVERRTVIEVKVGSTQNVGACRSSLVINKFLGSTPDAMLATEPAAEVPMRPPSPPKRGAAATAATSAAAAVVAAASSSVVTDKEMSSGLCGYNSGDTKLLFTSRRRDTAELLSSMRRCIELRRPLFIWETYCIATS